MRAWLVVLALAGCSAPPKSPPSNVSVRPERPEPPAVAKLTFEDVGQAGDPSKGEIVGTVSNHLKEPMVGTVIVATSPVMHSEIPVISDEQGRFEIKRLPPGRYTLVFYFVDAAHSGEVDVEAGRKVRVNLANWKPVPPDGPIEVHIKE